MNLGFAFIEMAEPEADKAIAELNGKVVDGQAIDVHEGRQKVHAQPSPEHIQHEAAPEVP